VTQWHAKIVVRAAAGRCLTIATGSTRMAVGFVTTVEIDAPFDQV
jgi:hypothetical protein